MLGWPLLGAAVSFHCKVHFFGSACFSCHAFPSMAHCSPGNSRTCNCRWVHCPGNHSNLTECTITSFRNNSSCCLFGFTWSLYPLNPLSPTAKVGDFSPSSARNRASTWRPFERAGPNSNPCEESGFAGSSAYRFPFEWPILTFPLSTVKSPGNAVTLEKDS